MKKPIFKDIYPLKNRRLTRSHLKQLKQVKKNLNINEQTDHFNHCCSIPISNRIHNVSATCNQLEINDLNCSKRFLQKRTIAGQVTKPIITLSTHCDSKLEDSVEIIDITDDSNGEQLVVEDDIIMLPNTVNETIVTINDSTIIEDNYISNAACETSNKKLAKENVNNNKIPNNNNESTLNITDDIIFVSESSPKIKKPRGSLGGARKSTSPAKANKELNKRKRKQKKSIKKAKSNLNSGMQQLYKNVSLSPKKPFNNIFNFKNLNRTGLREIVIDGSNVAMGHSNRRYFSVKGLQIAIEYFTRRGHKVIAFVPQFRQKVNQTSDCKLLNKLANQGYVVFTPSREVNGKRITPYDDRYIIQYATACEGIVVSADNFRDLFYERSEWRKTIEERILTPTWVGDTLMFPDDPLGRNGPNLNSFLRFP